jgi:putative nucleotidyltransferase with HDIG domain
MSDFGAQYRLPSKPGSGATGAGPRTGPSTARGASSVPSQVNDPRGPDPLAVRLEREIREGHIELPVLPRIADEVKQLIDRDADASTLVRALEREPSVAAALLKYANAAIYAGLRDVRDLQQAVMRLGLSSVRETVVSLSAGAVFKNPLPGHEALYETIWLHSLTTAIAARRLAGYVSVPKETAFLAGLLHDIGRVVVLRGIVTLRERDPQGFHVPDHTVAEFTDALHCSIGEALCEAWNIPADLREAIARHHDVALSEPKDALAAVVQVADLMAAKVGASLHPDPDIRLVDRPSFLGLGLDDVKVASLLVDLEDERDAITALF